MKSELGLSRNRMDINPNGTLVNSTSHQIMWMTRIIPNNMLLEKSCDFVCILNLSIVKFLSLLGLSDNSF